MSCATMLASWVAWRKIVPFPPRWHPSNSSHGPYLRKGPCCNLGKTPKKIPLHKNMEEKRSQQHHRISEITIEICLCVFFHQKTHRALNLGNSTQKFWRKTSLLENSRDGTWDFPSIFTPQKFRKNPSTPP